MEVKEKLDLFVEQNYVAPTIRQRLSNAEKDAEAMGAKLNVFPSDFYEDRLDVIWYGGLLGTISYGKHIIEIIASGDVRATLFEKNSPVASLKDRDNQGKFFDVMSPFIKNDAELYSMLDEPSGDYCLELSNNNWMEYRIQNTETKEYFDLPLLCNIIDSNNVLDAFDDVGEYIDIIEEYESTLRNSIISVLKDIEREAAKGSTSVSFYVTDERHSQKVKDTFKGIGYKLDEEGNLHWQIKNVFQKKE